MFLGCASCESPSVCDKHRPVRVRAAEDGQQYLALSARQVLAVSHGWKTQSSPV